MTTTPQLRARQGEDARRTSAQLSALLMHLSGDSDAFNLLPESARQDLLGLASDLAIDVEKYVHGNAGVSRA
jgi:hypothetical protein